MMGDSIQQKKKLFLLFDDDFYQSSQILPLQANELNSEQKTLKVDPCKHFDQKKIIQYYENTQSKELNIFEKYKHTEEVRQNVWCQKQIKIIKLTVRKRMNEMLSHILEKYIYIHKANKKKQGKVRHSSHLADVFIHLYELKDDFKQLMMFIKIEINKKMSKIPCKHNDQLYLQQFIKQAEISLKCICYSLHTNNFVEGYSCLALRHQSEIPSHQNKTRSSWKEGKDRLEKILSHK